MVRIHHGPFAPGWGRSLVRKVWNLNLIVILVFSGFFSNYVPCTYCMGGLLKELRTTELYAFVQSNYC